MVIRQQTKNVWLVWGSFDPRAASTATEHRDTQTESVKTEDQKETASHQAEQQRETDKQK